MSQSARTGLGHYRWFAGRMFEGFWWFPLTIFGFAGMGYYLAGFEMESALCFGVIGGSLIGRASGVNDFA